MFCAIIILCARERETKAHTTTAVVQAKTLLTGNPTLSGKPRAHQAHQLFHGRQVGLAESMYRSNIEKGYDGERASVLTPTTVFEKMRSRTATTNG